tara:strand:+ start:2814 stop:3245 length:432 start_codon:yes stop_codon:yes gene_type:complete
MPKSNSTELIEELLKTIDRVGLKKTIQGLRDTTNPLDEVEILQEYIISKTCNDFQITKNTLLTGRKNSENRTNAIGVVCVLLKNHCKLTQTDIAKTIRKDNSNVNKYIKKYENLDANFKKDLDIIRIMNKINTEIINFNIITT